MRKSISLLIFFVLLLAAALWALEAIQTQMSTDGNFEVSLIRAKVKGEVLTIQVLLKNTSSRNKDYGFYFKDIYYTDTKEKKKYYGLRDTNGHYIAGPVEDWSAGGVFRAKLEPNAKAIFWIKFPAPPATTETIDIYIPWALPFEDVKITR